MEGGGSAADSGELRLHPIPHIQVFAFQIKTSIFLIRGCGPALDDQPGVSRNSADMPASVLEPLHARSGTSATNPFGEYDAQESSQQLTQVGGARTAFASVSDRTSGGEHRENASPVLYPEGLPKFLGVLRPTMTFGICNSTLSRGMDFIAHFVAITTVVCFLGILFAVSWMQKLCLPIARQWNGNYTFGFGAFMAILAIFSWRSAANFDLKRSKVFLFLLGWRLHFFMLLSLLMALGLALKPQLHAHIETSVRACVLENTRGDPSPFHPPVSTVFALPTLSHAFIKDFELPAALDLSDNKGKSVEVPAVIAQAPSEKPFATAAETEAEVGKTPTNTGTSADTSAANQPVLPMLSTPSVLSSEMPSVEMPPAGVAPVDSSNEPPVANSVHTFNDESQRTNDQSGNAEVGKSTDAAPTGPQEAPKTDSAVAASATEGTATPTPTALASPPEVSPSAASLSEVQPQESASSTPHETDTPKKQTAAAQLKDFQKTPQQVPAPAQDSESQKLAVAEAQRSAVQESNTVVVVVLVLASVALLFELYLVYACWSFKVWMERGFESVVLAGVPSFSGIDAGSGWLAYAVRMPQTVQMETYGNDGGRGSQRLPLFVQTTDTSDCAAHLGLPMTGRW